MTTRSSLEEASEIKDYVQTAACAENLLKMAKFGVAVDGWMKRTELQATAIQCWTAMEEFFGVVPCTVMSMMSNSLVPSACEVDIMGALAMHILAQASQLPSAIVDWNNNYGEDPDKAVIFHCSNLPKDIFKKQGEGSPEMYYQEIIAGTVGADNTYGTIYGRIQPNDFTYLRVSTDDLDGKVRLWAKVSSPTARCSPSAATAVRVPVQAAAAHLRQRLASCQRQSGQDGGAIKP